jgi:hypothetical protein
MQPSRAKFLLAIFLGLSVFGSLLATSDAADTSSAPTDAQIRNLQQQIRAMQEQLEEMGNAQEAPARQRLMQQNWQSMLHYMQEMQSMPWMTSHPDEMGPGMMGHGMMGRGRMGRRHPGDWMMGCPMVGGAGGGWQLPPDMDAGQYRSQMRRNTQRMYDQMSGILSSPDPAKRQRMLQEHWQNMYRNMQTMRGMGWMWGGPGPGSQPETSAPDATSQGAQLVSRYCTQCHARPSPKLHSASEWKAVISRMEMNMQNFRAANWRGVKIPSESEFRSIIDYMQKNAH